MLKRIAVFDLDGTLLDTLNDLASAVNRALAAFGYPPRAVGEVRGFIGSGSLLLLSRAAGVLPESDECAALRERFVREYSDRLFDETVPYDGIVELVKKLDGAGVPVAVVSNKDDVCVKALIESFFGKSVKTARGVTDPSERKPDTRVTMSVLNEFGCRPENAVFIGDGANDFKTASLCGIPYIPVGYGFTDPDVLEGICGTKPLQSVASLDKMLCDIFGIV